MKVLNFYLAFALIIAIKAEKSERDWTYEVIDLKGDCSDKDQVDIDLNVLSEGQDETLFNGYIDVKVPVNDSTFIEVTLEKKATEASDYKLQPLKFPNSTLTHGMNFLYAKFVMDALKDCAPNAPQFEKFVPPFEPVRIEFKNCKINLDNFPAHMPEGFYKINLKATGPFEVIFEVYLRVTPISA